MNILIIRPRGVGIITAAPGKAEMSGYIRQSVRPEIQKARRNPIIDRRFMQTPPLIMMTFGRA